MTLAQKLRIMEEIWDDLSRAANAFESPEWHEVELKERESRIETGETTFRDWEAAKSDLRRRIA